MTPGQQLKQAVAWEANIRAAKRSPALAWLRTPTSPRPPAAVQGSVDDIVPSRKSKPKPGQHVLPPLREKQIAVGTAERAVQVKEGTTSPYIPTVDNHANGLMVRTQWRPMNKLGHIHGIETIYGRAVATDGILVVIQRPHGPPITGHLENFVEEKEVKTKKPSKRQLLIAELRKILE